MFFWLLKNILLGPILRLVFRPKVTGTVPRGPAIIASNHLSFCDSLFLPLVVPGQMVFIGKDDYFVGKGIKGRLMAAFFRGVGTIPVDRRGGSEAADALHTALRVLQQGRLFGIYPEGTRSPDARLYRGKTGAARLAVESGAPVYPCGLIRTNEIQPTGYNMPREDPAPTDQLRRAIATTARAPTCARRPMRSCMAIQELSGQEYVDVYASSVKLKRG